MHNYRDTPEKFDPSRPAFQDHSRSLVPDTNTDRSATYFLLVFHDRISCKGARITYLAPLLHHQPTFDDNKFHQPRRSNISNFKNCHVVASKFYPLSRCHVIAASIVIFGNKTNFLPFKEEDNTSSSMQNVQTKP